jgi:hypothetical protein
MTTTTTNTTATTTNTDTDVIDSNSKLLGVYGPIGDNGNGNGKSKRKNKKQDNNNDNKAISTVGENTKKPFYIQKYSKDVPLLEAVIINRQPFFLQVIINNNNNNGEPVLVDRFELNDIILYPKETHSYTNEPYEFESRDEIIKYIELAKKITNFDQIFKLVKNIFKKYVDAEDHYIAILAADTIYSYFQDKFATTHYLICIGDNSSGKNSILTTFANLGYRVFLATNVSAANVYTFLGSIEDCQGTLAEDELNNLEYDIDKMNVHKSGYSRSSGRIPKIDLHSGRVQEVYLTYCFKIFASELSPDSSKAKGILRSFIINCITGRPQYNIKEVFENSNDVEHVKLRNELDKTRKLLLAYRMLHHDDIIKDVNLNIYNREAELTKPLIRLFRESPEVLKELLPALSKLLNAKRKVKSNSLEAKLYVAVSNLVPSNPDYIIGHSAIIEEVRKITNGQLSPCGEQAFYTTDLSPSKVTHRRIIDTLVDKFKALRTSKGSGDEKERALQFKVEDLNRKGKEYDVPDEIKILSSDNYNNDNLNSGNNLLLLNEPDSFDAIFHYNNDGYRAIVSNGNGTEGTQGTEFRDKGECIEALSHLVTNNNSVISGDDINNIHNNTENIIKNHEPNVAKMSDNTSTYPIIPSQSSQSSHSNSNQLEPSKHPDSSNDIVQPIVSVEEFFKDDPDTPWEPLPTHNLEQSPCYPIIKNKGEEFYYCKLHPKVSSIHLDSIEQHCKYKDPDGHKAELLKHLSLNLSESNSHVEKMREGE